MPRHLYRRPDAELQAEAGAEHLVRALGSLDAAEQRLAASGYKGAARGVSAARARVKDWHKKVQDELRAISKGEL